MTPAQHSQEEDRAAKTKIDQGRLAVEQGRLKVEQDKAGKGKPLSQMEADKISDIDKGLTAVRELRESLATGSTGTLANLEAKYAPNALGDLIPSVGAAKATQADIVRAQQVVGRIIHGGVLRKNDTEAAAQYMPQMNDSKSVIKRKLDDLEKMAVAGRTDHLANLGKAGYDVSNFKAADVTPADPKDPMGIRR
jgi:hypothetical protein